MNSKGLTMVLTTLLIGVPLCVLTPSLDMPAILENIFLSVGIVLCFVGIASSIILLRTKDIDN